MFKMNSISTSTWLLLNVYELHLNTTIASYNVQEQDPTVIFFKASLIYRRLLEVTQIFEIKCNNFAIDVNLLHKVLQSAVSKLIAHVNIAIHLRLKSFQDMQIPPRPVQ